MAVCEFGVKKGLLYKEKSVPQESVVICEFGVIKWGDRSGENCTQSFFVSYLLRQRNLGSNSGLKLATIVTESYQLSQIARHLLLIID